MLSNSLYCEARVLTPPGMAQGSSRPAGRVLTFAWSEAPQSMLLAVALDNATVILLNEHAEPYYEGAVLSTKSRVANARCLCWSPAASGSLMLAIGWEDGSVMVWADGPNANDRVAREDTDQHATHPVTFVLWSPDASRLISGDGRAVGAAPVPHSPPPVPARRRLRPADADGAPPAASRHRAGGGCARGLEGRLEGAARDDLPVQARGGGRAVTRDVPHERAREEDGHLRLRCGGLPAVLLRRRNGRNLLRRRHGPLERRRRSARCPARCDALRSEYRRRGATWIAATARRPTTWVAGALLYHAENDTLVAITKVGSTRQASPHSACRTTGRRQNPLRARLAPLRRRRTCSPRTSSPTTSRNRSCA